jgi:hypothetical protein
MLMKKTLLCHPAKTASLISALTVGLLGLTARASATPPPDYHYSTIVSSGDPVPGVAGDTFSLLVPWAFNRHGQVAMDARFASGKNGSFLYSHGRLIQITLRGVAAPGGGTFGLAVQGPSTLSEHGELGFSHLLEPFTYPYGVNSGAYLYSSKTGALTPIVIPYVTRTPSGEVFQGSTFHTHINNQGEMALSGIFSTTQGISGNLGNGVFFRDQYGTIHNVASPGDPAPSGRTFDFAINPSLNDNGDVAFAGHVAGDECVDFGIPQSVWIDCGTSVYLRRSSGQILSIALQGESAPGGGTFRLAYAPFINNRGDIVFMGDLTAAPAYGSDLGVYLYADGVTRPIARPGDAMPGGGVLRKATNYGYGNHSINDRSEIAFNGYLDTTTDGASDTGLYVWRRGHLHLVARTGSVLPGIGTVKSVLYGGSNGTIINDRSQVMFLAQLTDGRNTIVIATPSEDL